MGTHPIFESDFDCLTDMSEIGDAVTKVLTADTPELIEPFAEKLGESVFPSLECASTDLRAASLRDWFVELLWIVKETDMEKKLAVKTIENSVQVLKSLVDSDSVASVVKTIIERFSSEQKFENQEKFTEFLVVTLVQHHRLWKRVLTKNRETRLITREIEMANLGTETAAMSLNMAIPAIYKEPPQKESETTQDNEEEAVSLQQLPPGASVSRVTRIYDRVTNKMMEEMKQELKNMIDKTEVELKEKYIKVT